MNTQAVEEKLEKLLEKLHLSKPITVGDIKDCIWNARKPNDSFQLFFLLTENEKDKEIIDETMHLLQDAWNYFPHRMLGGKSPNDLVLEYQQTGKVDRTKQEVLPKKGRSLQEIFEGNYPDTVKFIKIDKNTWGFDFPKLYRDLTEQLWELEESRVSTDLFEKELYRILKLIPELFDATNDLAHLYGKKHEPGLAKVLYEQTIKNARKYIPNTFIPGKDRVIWAYIENRPFLRLLAGYAIFVEQYEGTYRAIPLYEEILAFNPNDNQGIRAILATAYLKTNQPEKIIELASHYAGDSMPDVVMGKLLALLMLKKTEQSKKYLRRIKEYQSHVIKELLKQVHPKPVKLMKDRVTVGGEDEAYYYWHSQGKFWQETLEALEFLAQETKDIQSKDISITDNDMLAVDFFHDFIAFLKRLKDRPIKRTLTGNISLKDIEALLQELKTVQSIVREFYDMKWRLRSEDEIRPLRTIKVLAAIINLTRKNRDKLLLTKNGQEYLTKLSPVDQFKQLLQNYWYRFNWQYFAGFSEKQQTFAQILQMNQGYIWKKLSEKENEWIDYKTFCQTLRDEFNLRQFLEEPYSKPEETLYRRIQHILFEDNLVLFGCVETQTEQGKYKWEKVITRFRSTKIGLAMYPRR